MRLLHLKNSPFGFAVTSAPQIKTFLIEAGVSLHATESTFHCCVGSLNDWCQPSSTIIFFIMFVVRSHFIMRGFIYPLLASF